MSVVWEVAEAESLAETFGDCVVAGGCSNGANIAAASMLLHPGVIVGACLLHPIVVYTPEKLPNLNRAPFLISAGQSDSVVTRGRPEALGRLLAEAGAHVDIAVQNAGHDLPPRRETR